MGFFYGFFDQEVWAQKRKKNNFNFQLALKQNCWLKQSKTLVISAAASLIYKGRDGLKSCLRPFWSFHVEVNFQTPLFLHYAYGFQKSICSVFRTFLCFLHTKLCFHSKFQIFRVTEVRVSCCLEALIFDFECKPRLWGRLLVYPLPPPYLFSSLSPCKLFHLHLWKKTALSLKALT